MSDDGRVMPLLVMGGDRAEVSPAPGAGHVQREVNVDDKKGPTKN